MNFTSIPFTGGLPANNPPTPPVTTIEVGAGGTFIVTSLYYFLTDTKALQADKFHIYLSTTGDPLGASPITVAVGPNIGGFKKLVYTTSSEAYGTTMSVTVRTYRSEDMVESTNSDVEAVTSEEPDFGIPSVQGYWLNVAQQQQ
jgi:hypothetical protein